MDSYATVGEVEFRVPWIRCHGDWEDTSICIGEDEQDVREILRPGLEEEILESAYLDLLEQIKYGGVDLQIKAKKEAAAWRQVNEMASRCLDAVNSAMEYHKGST